MPPIGAGHDVCKFAAHDPVMLTLANTGKEYHLNQGRENNGRTWVSKRMGRRSESVCVRV